MNRSAPWTWAAAGVVLDRDVDGAPEQVWLNPDLPPERERDWLPLGVEVFCWFAEVDNVNAGLRALWQAFGRDSVLVAVRCQGHACHALVYTAVSESVVDRRYLAVRDVLRPIAMGVRLVRGPGWKGLAELLSSLQPEPVGPRVGDSEPPGALR